jgi:predicted nucleic acid-binding Zn ribbon protein
MEPISRILFTLFRGSPQRGEWIVACLEGAWAGLMGDRISQVCRPLRFENACLTIEILDAAWDETLRGMEPELLLRIRQSTGDEIRELHFTAR